MVRLHPFQEEGLTAIERFGGRALLADEMGLGKTIQSLAYIYRHPELRPVVIVTPASVKFHWRAEAWMHFRTPLEVLSGRPDKVKQLQGEFFVLNYDILAAWLPSLLALKPKCVILDEVHFIKHGTAQRTKAALHLVKGVPSVIGLSGTPLSNRPIELWTVLKAIRPELFPSREKFAWRYCAPRWTPWGWQFQGATHLKELHRILRQQVMIRRRKVDVLQELPEKDRRVVFGQLPDMETYRLAENDFLGWLATVRPDRVERAARNQALTRIGYLLRWVAKEKRHWVLQWIRDFLEANPNLKLVAFTGHTAMIDWLKEKLGSPLAVVIDGRTPQNLRPEVVRRFQNHSKTRVLLGNWIAAGVGINLTAAHHAVAIDLPWSPAELVQAEDRIHRIGQRHTCQITYLIAHGTLEEKQMRLLQKKARILEEVLHGTATADNLDLLTALLEDLRSKTPIKTGAHSHQEVGDGSILQTSRH